MATYETKGRLTYKDENSDNHIIYPVTKMDCIEDMPDIETEIAESVAAYLEDNPVETPDITDQVSRAETAASAAEAAKESASASANNAGGYASVANTHAKNAQTYASSASSSATRAEEAAIRAEEAVASIPESGGGTVKTVNGVVPDENGNVEITIPDSGENADQSGGLSATASALLITILRNGVYTSDQSANIDALAAELSVTEPEVPDIPVEPDIPDIPEEDVTQTESILSIVSGVTATQTGNVLAIA